MKLSELVEILDERLENSNSYSWDNTGILISNGEKEINKILLTLEVSKEVLDEAKKLKVDMILSHHPLFMGSVKTLLPKNIYENFAIELIKNDISLYSCHTNYDKLKDGLNDYVIKMLDIKNVEILMDEKDSEDYGMGRIAQLKKEIGFDEFINEIKNVYKLEEIRLIGKKKEKIKKIALVTGAGSEFSQISFKKGADVFLTGDMKYHNSQEALFYDNCILDIGHYGSEKFFPKAIKKTLNEVFDGSILLIESDALLNPIKVLG